MTNNDAASAYGSKLNLLADQLHEDIGTFKSVHSDFGSMLNEELNAFASRSSKSLEEDKSYLDGQLECFGQAIQRSKASFGKHHEDALALNAEVARAQEELQQNLMAWMTEQRQVAEKAIHNIKHVQETHLAVVSGISLVNSSITHGLVLYRWILLLPISPRRCPSSSLMLWITPRRIRNRSLSCRGWLKTRVSKR